MAVSEQLALSDHTSTTAPWLVAERAAARERQLSTLEGRAWLLYRARWIVALVSALLRPVAALFVLLGLVAAPAAVELVASSQAARAVHCIGADADHGAAAGPVSPVGRNLLRDERDARSYSQAAGCAAESEPVEHGRDVVGAVLWRLLPVGLLLYGLLLFGLVRSGRVGLYVLLMPAGSDD